MNCAREVSEEEAAIPLQVFLCPTCNEAAAELLKKARSGLENMMAILADSVRDTFADPDYAVGPAVIQKMNPEDALAFVLIMNKDRKQRSWNSPASSRKATKRSALTAGGQSSSPKPSAVD